MLERFERPVRCKDGHLFTTLWIPLGSVKAIRLGGVRFQRCPAGDHQTTVRRVDERTADPAQLEAAAQVHDLRVP